VRRRRFSALLLACAAVPAAILAGCGGGGGGGGNVDVGPAAAVPQNALVYLDATVKPTGSAEANAKAALEKVLDTNDPGGKIVSLIEKESKGQGHPFKFQQDVAPWLGQKAGVFFTDLTDNAQKGAAVVETTDPTAALAFARKVSGATATTPTPKTYNGATYQRDPSETDTFFGTVGNVLVEGDESGVKAAIDAEKGDSLGDSGDFKDAISELPGDRLGTLYTVPKTLLDSLGSSQIDPSSRALFEKTAGAALEQPVSGALTASADSFDLEFVGGNSGAETPESSLLGTVPAQSWLALGIGNLGSVVRQQLDQSKDQIPNYDLIVEQIEQSTGASLDQLTAALGDAALYVEGIKQSTLTGALVIQTKNPGLTGRLLGQLESLLRLGGARARPLNLTGGGTGFQINDRSVAPVPIEIAQEGGQLVIGYGANSAARTLTPAHTLADKAPFSSARDQVSDLGADLFLYFPSIFKLAESTGAKSDPDYVRAKPYLDALDYLVSGSGSKGDQTEVKAVLGLR
jgi:hypothetical protein